LVLLCWGIPRVTRATIASENALTGNLPGEWDVNGIGDPSIQGFATDFSVDRGTLVQFKINTNAAAYRIDIYRFSYYGGRGARKVATINPATGPFPPVGRYRPAPPREFTSPGRCGCLGLQITSTPKT
jgi:hypothetical protein